jgi:DNA topoisomerase-1
VSTPDLDTALRLLSLPRDLGLHPETNKPVEANVGRFGPYVKHDSIYKSIPKSESVYDITLARAVELLAQPKSGQGGATGRQLGPHPIDQKPVAVLEGRYGPYVKHGNVNVTVPSDLDPATLTLDDAVDLLAEKAAKELAKTGSTAAPLAAAQRPRMQRPGAGGQGRQQRQPQPTAGDRRSAPAGGRGPGQNRGQHPRAAGKSAGGRPPPPGRNRPGRPQQRPGAKSAPRRRPV